MEAALARRVAPESNLTIDIRMANRVTTQRRPMPYRRAVVSLALLLAVVSSSRSQPGAIEAEVIPYGIAADGAHDDRVTLRIEEEPTGRLVPLLPYVFFDEGSSAVPARYGGGDSAASNDPFVRRYRMILSIVGERMRANPSERLVITGTSSMTPAERRVDGLARRRAEAVAALLASRFGIDRSRLVVRSTGLPSRASNNAHAEGRAENRRVELSGSDVLLAPVAIADTLVRASSTGMRLVTAAMATTPLDTYNIELRHEGKVFRRLSGSQLQPMYTESFTESELRWFAANPDGIDVTMMARTAGGDSITTPRRTILFRVERVRRALMPAEGRPQDRESIVLFDFDSAELGDDARTILRDLVARIPATATLAVTGFTDETGDSVRNHDLSQRRAASVQAALPDRVASAGGAGESGGHHWNTTPEDRFYSRVARIMVRW